MGYIHAHLYHTTHSTPIFSQPSTNPTESCFNTVLHSSTTQPHYFNRTSSIMSPEKPLHKSDIESRQWNNVPSTEESATNDEISSTKNVSGTPRVLFNIFLGLTSVCIFSCLIPMTLEVRPTSTFVRSLVQSSPTLCLQAFTCQTITTFHYVFNVLGSWDDRNSKFTFGHITLLFAWLIGCHLAVALGSEEPKITRQEEDCAPTRGGSLAIGSCTYLRTRTYGGRLMMGTGRSDDEADSFSLPLNQVVAFLCCNVSVHARSVSSVIYVFNATPFPLATPRLAYALANCIRYSCNTVHSDDNLSMHL